MKYVRIGTLASGWSACAVAALTVYDMVKGIERGVTIERISLIEKSGGRSGEWRRQSGVSDEGVGGS